MACRFLFVVVVVVSWCCFLAAAQITFSRDWSPGKRSTDPSCGKHAAALCQIIMNELRQLAACEVKSILHFQTEDSNVQPELFMDAHGGR